MMNILSYNGRVGRLNYFLWKISLVVFFGILIKVYTDFESFGIVFLLLAVFIFLTSFAEVQRLHDLDRPGIQFWLLFIPIFNIYLSLVLFIKKGSDGLNQYGIDPLKREVKYGQYISQNEGLREMGVGAEKKTVDHPNSSIGMNEGSLWKFDTKDKSNKKEQIKNPFNRKSQQKGNEATGQFSEPSQMAVIDEERIYAFIADEIDAGAIDKGLWTRLFVECDGDEKHTKVLYIKQRAKRLIQAEKLRMMEKNQDNPEDDCQVQPKMHKVIQKKKGKNISKLSDSDDSNRKVKNALLKSGVHHWGTNYESQDLQQRCPECGDFFHGIGFTTCDRCGCQLVPE